MDIAAIVLIALAGYLGYKLLESDIEDELEKQPVRIKKDEHDRRNK
jgi:hypothetical protein